MTYWYVLPINPEPWAIGSVTAGRRNGKIRGSVSPNPNLVAFQAAVREEFEAVTLLEEGEYELAFWFWRQQAMYLDAADRRRQRNQADATNMQKALEDALQGVLFSNDRNVRRITSQIVEQGPSVAPLIVIAAKMYEHKEPTFPDIVDREILRLAQPTLSKSKNKWPPE